MKTTLVIGASENPSRYAYIAIQSLLNHGHSVVALGNRSGMVFNIPIQTDKNIVQIPDLDTVTLYVSSKHQPEYIDWIIAQKPKRVIFNPGTENEAFEEALEKAGIEPVEACTLVMLATGQY